MARLGLKSLIGKNKEAVAVIANLIDVLDQSIGVEDAEGRLLLGNTGKNGATKFAVMFEGENLGWVFGGEKAEAVAGLLAHLIGKEAEKKTLGNEVLGIYRELNLIYNFSEKLAASLEIGTVASMAIEQAGQLIQATAGAVLMLDEGSRMLEPVASFGDEHVPGGRKLGEGVIGTIAANGQAEIVNDVRSDSRRSEKEEAISSLICAPLKVKEKAKGVIVLVSETPVAYTAGELKLLTSVASQAVLAIENALLHEKLVQEATRTIEARRRELEIAVRERTAELEKQKENVELLSEIGRDITASLSIKNVIDTVYEHVNALMDAAVFGIGIYNEKEDRIDFPATKEKGKTLPLFYNSLGDANRPGVWCFKNQKEMVINDYDAEYSNYFDELQLPVQGGYALSVLYLPLTYKDKKMGVITAQSFNKNAYTEYHLNILRNLATYTAIALDNAETYRELDATLQNLKATQQQLLTQEKLASLGQLTAGIAHEIKNPLNFVNNFAELSTELVVELKEDLEKQRDKFAEPDLENLEAILADLEQNARKINEHGKRADSIVKSMLQHSRGNASERQPTDLNAVLEEDLNLAYHGMRAQDSSFNIRIETQFDESLGKVDVVPQDISRVFLNIITNGFYAAHKKRQNSDDNFTPTLLVSTQGTQDGGAQIRIKDNGNGVPKDVREKLFEPFFTTKPAGQGTGLGLSISYEIIVQEHGGEIYFDTRDGEFTEFVIQLPATA